MMKSIFAILCLVVPVAVFAQTELPVDFARWAEVKGPTSGTSEIHGGYNAGCITGAQQLPLNGQGFSVVRTQRNRFYGHPLLVSYIQDLGVKVNLNLAKEILIEDMGFARGGPFFTGHASHQVGLDVDISLELATQKLSAKESEAYVSPSYVTDRKVLKSNWQSDQIKLTELAANSQVVNRIFVAPAIKKYFCQTNPSAPWLYKLRAWWGHDDHLHVRLSCPKDSPACKSQTALDSTDNGCGGDLTWWFSAEADKQWSAMESEPPTPRKYPTLPNFCEQLVRQ